jgi:3-oxoadipate enol-lactonase
MLDVATNTRTHGIQYTADKSVANNFPALEQRAVPPESLAEVRRAVAASDPEGYAKTCEMIVDPSHTDPDYGKIMCPVVLVAGDMDVISPLQRSQDVSELSGGPSWIEIVKSGHQPLIEETRDTASAVLKLLNQVQGNSKQD